MKKHLKWTCLTSVLSAFSSTSLLAAECGKVTIANGAWQSAEVLAHADQSILQSGFGCSVEFIIGDTVPILTSMAEKGQPDIMPEAWVDLMPDLVHRGISEGRLLKAAQSLSTGGIQGWWIPKYLADRHSDIKTIADALKHPELFPAIENPAKGAVFNGPAGWGGTVTTAQLFKANDTEGKNFVLIDSGSAAGLDGLITKAYERKKGFITYYWSPASLLGKYAMVKLDEGVEHDAAEWKRCTTVANCPGPKPNAWPVDRVYALLSKAFADRALPEVKQYLEKRAWSNETVNKIMAWMSDHQATGKEGAKRFLLENESLWTKWAASKVSEKVKASLENSR